MLRRRMLIMLGVVLLIVLVLAAYKAFSIYTMIQGFSAPKPPTSVAVATATEQAQDRLRVLGFHDPAAALRHIEALTNGVSRAAEIQQIGRAHV